MKNPIVFPFFAAALLASACGKDAPPPAPAAPPSQVAAGALTPAVALRPPPTSILNAPFIAPAPIGPTDAQKQVMVRTLSDMTIQVAQVQKARSKVYAGQLAAWKAQQAMLTDARTKLQEQLADPHLSLEERSRIYDEAVNHHQESAIPEPMPFRGDLKANAEFDSLIYAFRQAREARNYAKAQAVAEQMKGLSDQVSPDLVDAYLQEANR